MVEEEVEKGEKNEDLIFPFHNFFLFFIFSDTRYDLSAAWLLRVLVAAP